MDWARRKNQNQKLEPAHLYAKSPVQFRNHYSIIFFYFPRIFVLSENLSSRKQKTYKLLNLNMFVSDNTI